MGFSCTTKFVAQTADFAHNKDKLQTTLWNVDNIWSAWRARREAKMSSAAAKKAGKKEERKLILTRMTL